jgi:recombination protein RecR
MIVLSESLLSLQKSLQLLPGIGEKTAQRLAIHLMSNSKDKAKLISDAILNALDKCKPCSNCFLLSDTNPCPICADDSRDSSLLCIVENSKDIFLIENTNEYHGRYFVLGNLLSPIDGIGVNEIRLKELDLFIKNNCFSEIILALSPSTEGETTMQFLSEHISQFGINVTRLSTGIPYGGDMEYSGVSTLVNAFRRRYPIKD